MLIGLGEPVAKAWDLLVLSVLFRSSASLSLSLPCGIRELLHSGDTIADQATCSLNWKE